MDNRTKYEHPDFFLFLNLYFFFGDCETRASKKQSLADKHIATFEATFDELEIQLGSVFTLKRMGLRKEKDDLFNELLEFINLNITGEWRKIRHPDNQFLDGVLATEDFYTEPNLRLGDKYINVLSIDAYPAQSYMGVLQALVNLPCQYHWVNRVCFLDTMDAEKQIEKYRKGWQQKVRGFVDQIMGRHSDNVNYDAVEMKEDAQQAKSENNSGLVRYLYLTSTIVIFDETLESLTYTTKLIRETVRNIVNFNARVETINAVDAYLGSLPSHIIENVRKPIMHSGNMVHIVPCSTLWTGETSAPCPFYPLKSPPLVKVSTTGNSSFNLNLHEEDVGHTFMSGKTGTGKSSKLCLLTAQFDRYPNAQVFIFDKGLSAKVLCKLSGGKHYEILSGNSSICFAPLQNIHEPSEFLWAFNWLQDIVEINNFKMSPEQVKKLNGALKLVAQMDNTEGQSRNIDSLIVKLQDKELKAIFGQYATGGAYKDILNQPVDNIALSQITVFEYGALLDLNAKIKLPVLFYLCHLVERQLDGRPTLVNIDEAWKFLDEKKAGDRLLQWLREWRKSNAAVILSTQNVNAIEQNNPLVFSEISMACSTKLFLANPNATEEQFIGAYKKLGCKDAEIRRVRRLKSKREYFIKKGDFRRTYSLDMNDREIGLSVVGASSKEDLKMIDKLNFEQANEEELLMQWFDYKGLDLDYVQSLIATVKARWPS